MKLGRFGGRAFSFRNRSRRRKDWRTNISRRSVSGLRLTVPPTISVRSNRSTTKCLSPMRSMSATRRRWTRTPRQPRSSKRKRKCLRAKWTANGKKSRYSGSRSRKCPSRKMPTRMPCRRSKKSLLMRSRSSPLTENLLRM